MHATYGDGQDDWLAGKVGVNAKTIQLWKKGPRVPKANEVNLICAALGVSADYLVGLSEVPDRDVTLVELVRREVRLQMVPPPPKRTPS